MLQFSKKPERGRCTFADRHHFRFELVWSEVPGEPDYDRMLSDYRTRLELSDHLEEAAEEQHGQWMAVAGRQDDRAVTRFGRHFPSLGIMAEFVVLHPGDRDTDLEQSIIKSGYESPPKDRRIEWQAFGLRAFAPEFLTMEDVQVAPAHIHLRFKHQKDMEQCNVERMGMLSHWLKGSMEDWFDSQRPASAKDWTVSPITSGDTSYLMGTGTLPGTRRFGPSRHVELAAWIDPEDGRLYRCRSIQQDPLQERPPWERTLCKQPSGPLEEVTQR